MSPVNAAVRVCMCVRACAMGKERDLLLPIEFGLGDYFDLEAGVVGRPPLDPTLQLLHLAQQPTQRVGLAKAHKREKREERRELQHLKEREMVHRREVRELYRRRWRGQSDKARVQPKGTPLQRSVRWSARGRGTSCTGSWRGARAGGEGE